MNVSRIRAVSPSATAGSGCTCYRTYSDPEFGLPVVAEHYRTCSDDDQPSVLPWKTENIDRWTYHTYIPLGLRDGEACASLIIDRRADVFWLRSTRGVLSLLPERNGRGYGLEGAGGRGALADYIQQLADSDGRDTFAAGPRRSGGTAPGIETFLQSQDARRTQELTLADLKSLAA